MNFKQSFFLFLSVVLVSISLVACALILVKPNILFQRANGVTVKGFAVKQVVSDIGKFSCEISSTVDVSLGVAGAFASAKLDADTARKFIGSMGINPADLVSSDIKVVGVYEKDANGNDKNSVQFYRASTILSLQSKDVKLIEKLVRTVPELSAKNINVSLRAPEYYYSALEDMKIELIACASKNARERAEAIVGNGQTRLGGIMSASQGVFQITSPLSTETSSWGVYDTGTILKDVKCIVNVEFAIVR